MSIGERLAPALRHLLGTRTDLSPDGLGRVRDGFNARRRDEAGGLDATGVVITGTQVMVGPQRSIPVRIYRGGDDPYSPAVLYCHAGAFVLGNLDTDERQCLELARRVRCTVISVDYRLAPENPHPHALNDVVAVLNWAVAGAQELRIDTGRVAIAGSSAGGALAARVAQLSAAGSVPPVMFQLLHQPVLDDRPSPSKEEFVDTPGFDGPATVQMWRYYLGAQPASIESVPGHATDLGRIAATLITCAELDPLRDEAIDYALRLMWAGVPVELHVFPGACHGFDSLAPDWEVTEQLLAMQTAALRRAFSP